MLRETGGDLRLVAQFGRRALVVAAPLSVSRGR
ncbi:unannotated protein [freshwater metagenome]|uniref:Unannotated protein n=1 Tax=freshwater metagenome TaxID=449393 RepID=A0A6J6CJJ9_9ZZZZ